MAERIADIKTGERTVIGGYYETEDEDHNYEIRLEVDRIHSNFPETESSIEQHVTEFFDSVEHLDSDTNIRIERTG
jgi:hypothetical protein